MIKKLKGLLLGEKPYADVAADTDDRQQLALAALLVEMARADFDETQDEQNRIIDLLAGHFGLTSAESLQLLNRAREEADNAVCLFDFSRTLHQSLDEEQKRGVIRLLWEVALADNSIDKYEDYLVRKVADLLHVSPGDVLRIKHEVVEG